MYFYIYIYIHTHTYIHDYGESVWSRADLRTHALAAPFRHCCQEESPKRGLFPRHHSNAGWGSSISYKAWRRASVRGCRAAGDLGPGAVPAACSHHPSASHSRPAVPATTTTSPGGLWALALADAPGLPWRRAGAKHGAAREG